MNSVYTSFNKHLHALDRPEYMNVFKEYQLRKQIAHPDLFEYTFAGIVPWLCWNMLLVHNSLSHIQVEMKIERRRGSLLELFEEATDAQKAIMTQTKFWGAEVDEITLEPAIYIDEKSARYSETVLNSPIIMAIQLTKAKKKDAKTKE